MSVSCPCKGCEQRIVGFHDTCPKYDEYKQNLDVYHNNLKEYNFGVNMTVNMYKRHNVTRKKK